MLVALGSIIVIGGYLPPSTMKCISIGRMEMSEDGRDINVHYRLVRDSLPGASRIAGFREVMDIDSLFYDKSRRGFDVSSVEFENQRYVGQSYRKVRSPNIRELEVYSEEVDEE